MKKNYILILFIITIYSLGAIQMIKKDNNFSENAKIFFENIDNGENPENFILELSKKELIPFTDGSKITYIFLNKENFKEINLKTSFGKSPYKMKRYKNSDIFYLTFSYSKNEIDNTTYIFEVNNGKTTKIKKDPYNKNVIIDRTRTNIVRTKESLLPTIQQWRNLVPDGELSKNLKRDIFVYLPPKYFIEKDKSYPVLYMQDGQNIFDSEASNFGGWKVDTIATKLINNNEIEPIIIVGIENSPKRKEEYVGFSTLYTFDTTGYEDYIKEAKELNENYVNFVINKVKPLIDSNYRTKVDRDNTGIAGSSFGAGISLYIGFKHNDIFSKIAALSYGSYNPNVSQWKEKPFWITKYLLDNVVNTKFSMKVYLDCGKLDLDNTFYPRAVELYEGLKKIGFRDNNDILFILDEKRGHNEKAWADRGEYYLKFLFGKN